MKLFFRYAGSALSLLAWTTLYPQSEHTLPIREIYKEGILLWLVEFTSNATTALVVREAWAAGHSGSSTPGGISFGFEDYPRPAAARVELGQRDIR